MATPALLIAADANLPRQVKFEERREPQPGGMRGMPVRVRPAFLIAVEANLVPTKLSVKRGRSHNPECEACQ
jgi:hypothetical protein